MPSKLAQLCFSCIRTFNRIALLIIAEQLAPQCDASDVIKYKSRFTHYITRI